MLVRGLYLAAMTLLASNAIADTNTVLFTENFEHGIGSKWKQVKFGEPTDYQTFNETTNTCLRAIADKTCSALSVELKIPPPERLKLRWRWKVDCVPTNGTDRMLGRFDHAARVFVAFDTMIGPPRTINYMWANEEKCGVTLPHPSSSRSQIIVVESGKEHTGEWITEERDVSADWKTLFGNKTMPKIVGIGVMTDSDGTGSRITGYYDDIVLFSDSLRR